MDRERRSGALLRKVIALKSTQIFLLASVVLLALFTTLICIGVLVRYEVDTDVSSVGSVSYWEEKMPDEQKIWYDKGIEELRRALRLNLVNGAARNVVIFVAQGVRPEIVASARYKEDTVGPKGLIWDEFPHVAKLKNRCSNEQPCDLFTSSTALYGGVGTKNGFGGLDTAANPTECDYSTNNTHKIKSFLELAQEIGLRTGFVTDGRLTAPTTAALYAHVQNTEWECDVDSSAGPDCLDIAMQLFEESPGSSFNVIMGGGRQVLVANTSSSTADPISENVCRPTDGRNYLRFWRVMKRNLNQSYALAQTREQLQHLNSSGLDYVLGVFANAGLGSNGGLEDSKPQLLDMTRAAIKVLERNETGFFLVVESILDAENDVKEQIKKLLHFNETVSQISDKLSPDTLQLVLLTQNFQLKGSSETALEFRGDTTVYAKGPQAYLFQAPHEETYMTHVVNFALRMGPFNPALALVTKQKPKGSLE